MQTAFLMLLIIFASSTFTTAQTVLPQWSWASTIAGSGTDVPKAIAADSRNGVYCFGTTNSDTLRVGWPLLPLPGAGGTDCYLVKYDTLGTPQWAKRFGNSGNQSAVSITTDKNSDVIISGHFTGTIFINGTTLVSTGGQDIFVAKFRPDGSLVWARRFGGNADDNAGALHCDDQLNIYMVGKYAGTNFALGTINLSNCGTHNLFYGKLDSNGNASWARRGCTGANSYFYDVKSNAQGYIVFVGSLEGGSPLTFNPNVGSVLSALRFTSFVVYSDTAGNFIYQSTILDDRYYGTNMENDRSGGLVFGGYKTYSNLSFPPSAYVAGPTSSRSAFSVTGFSIGNDVVVDKQNRTCQILNAEGSISFGTGFNFSSGSPVPVLWVMNSALTTQALLVMSAQPGFSADFPRLAVDTLTGKLYAAGSISKSVAGGTFQLGSNSLAYRAGQDAVLVQIGITVVPTLRAFAGNDTAICVGDSAFVGSATGATGGIPPYTYAWSPSTYLGNPTASYTKAAPPTSRSYIMTVTDAQGATAKDTVAIMVVPPPSLGLDTTVFQACYGDSTNLLALYNTAGLTVDWNTATPQAVAPGVYRLVVRNAAGCSDTVFVTVQLEVATWTGTINSDWHTPGNWTINKVPSSVTHVIIPAGTANNCLIGAANAVVASLQLRNGASLTTANGTQVTVVGNCTVLPPA
jgi:hypothetical protein